jgi:predicted enzyme related to lactoylglutathione lyase
LAITRREETQQGQGPMRMASSPRGGMMKHPMPGAPAGWMAYVQVDDVAAATEKARSLGAAILQDRVEVPGYGRFTVFADPTGAVLALWQSTHALA